MGKHYKSNKKILFLSILRLLFIIALIISIIYIVKWYKDSKQNKELKEKISETTVTQSIENEETKYEVDFKKLKETNKDTVAWIKVNGTDIEYPVVQTTNNSYYLKRNFNKEKNKAGWMFADYKNKLDGTDKNIIIYGHNMKDNSMFGTLKNILNEEWYNNEENYIINFITEEKQHKYEVFSVYQIKNEDYYIKTDFAENEFADFIQILKNRSIKDFNIETTSEENILTLSTCGNNYNYRIVLHAKEIKE